MSQISLTSSILGKATLGEYGITMVKPQHSQTTSGVTCYGLRSDASRSASVHIPFKNVLFCTNMPTGDVELTYAAEEGNHVTIHKDVLDIQAYSPDARPDLAGQIMALSYTQSTPQPRIMVILNSHGGQGNARKLYHSQILPVLRAARVDCSYVETEYSGHAVDLARDMEIADFDVVACCSGDGVPHEVINGFYQRGDREQAFEKIAITQLPCGSGNALSLSSHGTNSPGIAAVRMLKSARTRMDVMAVTQGEATKLSFLSQAYGTIADSDIGTEHLRWMGPVRFDVGVAQRLLTKATYPCDLYVKYALRDGPAIQDHFDTHQQSNTKSDRNGGNTKNSKNAENAGNLGLGAGLEPRAPGLSAAPPADWEQVPGDFTDSLNIFYVGNMPYVSSDAQFFPAALPNDGFMDMVLTSAKTSFLTMAKVLFSVDKGGHVHSPDVVHAKISAYRLVPRVRAENHYISVDGESFPFQPLQVEVLREVMTVLLDEGSFVETSFSS